MFDDIRELTFGANGNNHYEECFQALHHQFVASKNIIISGSIKALILVIALICSSA